mmetsp:Transcript_163022/g.522764  ORF Transcript_163022/g.522764 Transcript_163022/m.522764 type:complete len:340 (-) Transcript_163022:187-1206(-)
MWAGVLTALVLLAAIAGLVVYWSEPQLDCLGGRPSLACLCVALLGNSPRAGVAARFLSGQVDVTATDKCQGLQLPVLGIYVINMDHQPQRYADFVDHLATLCGVDMGIVHRHSGIIVTTSSLSWPWVRDFIPGVSQVSLQRLGTFGLSLAHLSLWAKIHNSDMCKGSDVAKEYVLIFEDDERPKPGFTEAIVKLRHALDALPLEERPDFINLNVKRPKGDVVTTFELPFAVSVLRVAKTKSKLKTGPLDALGNQYNVWMSAYMVRCGGIGALVYHGGRYPGGKNSYNGISPIFDKQMSDMLANSRIHLKYFVLSPKNAISQHVEGVDSRKALDGSSRRR